MYDKKERGSVGDPINEKIKNISPLQRLNDKRNKFSNRTSNLSSILLSTQDTLNQIKHTIRSHTEPRSQSHSQTCQITLQYVWFSTALDSLTQFYFQNIYHEGVKPFPVTLCKTERIKHKELPVVWPSAPATIFSKNF